MNISFQRVVAIESVTGFNFFNATSTNQESPCHLAPWLMQWETWKVLNHEDPSSTADLAFGDIVGFRNSHFQVDGEGVCMSGFSSQGYEKVTTQPFFQDAERWRLVSPAGSESTAEITTADVFYLQQVNSGKYAKSLGPNNQNLVPLVNTPDESCEFRLIITCPIAG